MNFIKRLVSIILVCVFAITPTILPHIVKTEIQGQFVNQENTVLRTQLTFENVEKILSLDVKFVEDFDSYIIYYCVSPYFSKSVLVNSFWINCQISVKNEITTVGLPIITTGY